MTFFAVAANPFKNFFIGCMTTRAGIGRDIDIKPAVDCLHGTVTDNLTAPGTLHIKSGGID